MPWHDWQFYVVTATALWGAWIILRQLVPCPSGPACGACAGARAGKPKAAASGSLPVILEDRRRS